MTGCGGCLGCLDRVATPIAGLSTAGCGGACSGGCGGRPGGRSGSGVSSSCCPGSCCAGVQALTPRRLFNRPGLPEIAYRTATYRDLFDSMLARLASRPELASLTTRSTDDPAIALLDCWAIVGDSVTFAAERAANEGYLGTAVQADSLTRLARLVDYRPRPALGASGHLAFTMDPGANGTIAAGSQARSVAGPDELPQTFETAETIEARAEWNQLAVRLTRPFALSPSTAASYDRIILVGASLGLSAGLRIIFDYGTTWAADVRVITSITPDFTAGTTMIDLVPTGPVGVAAALDRLDDLIKDAVAATPAGAIGSVGAVLGSYGSAGFNTGTARGDGQDFDTVANLIRDLIEASAIAGGRGSTDIESWMAGPVRAVLDQADLALALMAANQRRLAPDIAYLQDLARAITCPPRPREPAIGSRGRADPACDRAGPLVGAAAILPALTRPPSRPPDNARALAQVTGTALDPQSGSMAALLAAIDPRLTGVLAPALGQQLVTGPTATAQVIALRTKASPLPDDDVVVIGEAGRDGTILTLDGAPDAVVPGSWLVSEQLHADNTIDTFANRVVDVVRYSRTLALPANAPATKAATTRVKLSGPAYRADEDVDLDRITVYYAGTALDLADERDPHDVGGSTIDLGQTYDGLQPGRCLIITGERTDVPGTTGVIGSELTMVAGMQERFDSELGGDAVRPTLVLAAPLAYTYRRASVVIYGNVASATQGERRSEVLGSGAAGQAGQAFALKQVSPTNPLTWLPDRNALGAVDTLIVRVDGVRWHETDDLTESGPKAHQYRTVIAADGSEKVVFGDGKHGSRLPTGIENVTASYRVGAGRAGNVRGGRITQLASHPLGTNAVTNPLPTTGGADGDQPEDVRRHARQRSLALDRLLSVADYADFTAARAGIGKAVAVELADGGRRLVHLTIAGVGDAPIDLGDQLVVDLRAALAELGDPCLPVRVAVRDLLILVLSAGIKVGADDSFDLIEPLVRAAVLRVAGFDQRPLGEPVYLSQITAAMQAVPGVEYVDVDGFGSLPGTIAPVPLLQALLALSGVAEVVDARPARYEALTHTVGTDPTGAADTLTSIALRYGVTVPDLARLNPALQSITLVAGAELVISRGVRPAQLALFTPEVPATLILRSIP